MFQKFWIAYVYPHASSAYAAAADYSAIWGAVVGILGCLRGFWWGLALAAAYWWLMSVISWGYNPSSFLRNDREVACHREINAYILRLKSQMLTACTEADGDPTILDT